MIIDMTPQFVALAHGLDALLIVSGGALLLEVNRPHLARWIRSLRRSIGLPMAKRPLRA